MAYVFTKYANVDTAFLQSLGILQRAMFLYVAILSRCGYVFMKKIFFFRLYSQRFSSLIYSSAIPAR